MSYEDRSGQILAVGVTMFLLAWISVSLRTYVRVFLIKAFGLDDAAMLGTACFFTAFLACEFGGIRYGTGKRRSELTDENAQTALRYWFFCEIFYTLCTSSLKIAVGLFLLRIAIRPVHVWIIHAIMICAGLLGLVYCGIMTFQCNPVSFWWDLNPNHHGKCISPKVVIDTTYLVSALNSFADWTFAILPIFIVKDLQMKKRQKVLVAVILGFAAVGSFATIIRAPFLWTMEEYKGEFLWRTSDIAIWTSTEVGIGIMAGCLATLRPLLRRFGFADSSSPDPSNKPSWSGPANDCSRRRRPYPHGYETMDEERFANGGAVNLTTVAAGRGSVAAKEDAETDGLTHSSDDSRVGILRGKAAEGISRKVVVTTTVERSHSPANSDMETDDGEGPRKPATTYTRV